MAAAVGFTKVIRPSGAATMTASGRPSRTDFANPATPSSGDSTPWLISTLPCAPQRPGPPKGPGRASTERGSSGDGMAAFHRLQHPRIVEYRDTGLFIFFAHGGREQADPGQG